MKITKRTDHAPWMDDDREWFRRHPGKKFRRRPPVPGEFSPEESETPPGYRIEVFVENARTFTNGDAIRLRWQLLVPIDEALQ